MRKTRNILLSAVFLVICCLMIALFTVFTLDSPTLDEEWLSEESCIFTADSGETTEVRIGDELGDARTDGYYTSVFRFTPYPNTVSELTFMMGNGDAEITLNGRTLFSGHVGSDGVPGASPSVNFTAEPEAGENVITAVYRYTDTAAYIYPALLINSNSDASERRLAAATNSSAILAGISGIAFVITAALFLLSIAFEHTDFSLIFLAVGIICYCVKMLFNTGAVQCPESVVGLVFDLQQLLTLPMIIIFIVFTIRNRRVGIIKYILIFTGILAGLMLLANVLGLIFDNVPALVKQLGFIVYLLYNQMFEKALTVACNYLIIICVAAALYYHIRGLIAIHAENTALESQNRAIVSGYENMVYNVRKTAEVRHEWKHDLLSLSLLYDKGKIDEIGEYLKIKNEFLSNAEKVRFTENFVFDVILNSVSARADEAGIDLKTHVNIPPTINIREEDLCQLLLNMFDNAFNACEKVKENKFISFTAEMKNGFLAIRCQNSTSGEQSSNGGDISHGWGLKNMEKVCKHYGSDLIKGEADGVYTVKTALQIGSKED